MLNTLYLNLQICAVEQIQKNPDEAGEQIQKNPDEDSCNKLVLFIQELNKMETKDLDNKREEKQKLLDELRSQKGYLNKINKTIFCFNDWLDQYFEIYEKTQNHDSYDCILVINKIIILFTVIYKIIQFQKQGIDWCYIFEIGQAHDDHTCAIKNYIHDDIKKNQNMDFDFLISVYFYSPAFLYRTNYQHQITQNMNFAPQIRELSFKIYGLLYHNNFVINDNILQEVQKMIEENQKLILIRTIKQFFQSLNIASNYYHTSDLSNLINNHEYLQRFLVGRILMNLLFYPSSENKDSFDAQIQQSIQTQQQQALLSQADNILKKEEIFDKDRREIYNNLLESVIEQINNQQN